MPVHRYIEQHFGADVAMFRKKNGVGLGVVRDE